MMTLLHAPDRIKSEIQLLEVDLQDDPGLYEWLKQNAEAEKSLPAPRAAGQWYRAGTGPHPTQGGIWVGGDVLRPLSTPPATAIVSEIDYDYTKVFGAWASQCSVRLYITNAAVTQAWTADVTANDSGTVTATGANIPANCRITYQLKVGNVTGGLFNPPYINGCDVTVHWL